MEGIDPYAVHLFSQKGGYPFLHLSCGFVGEGDGKDVPRLYLVIIDQVSDPAGDDSRFSRACTGQYQQRSVFVPYGGFLLLIQSFQIFHHYAPLLRYSFYYSTAWGFKKDKIGHKKTDPFGSVFSVLMLFHFVFCIINFESTSGKYISV